MAFKSKSKFKAVFIVCMIAIVYYAAFFTLRSTVFENYTLSPAKYQVSEHCIVVHGQAVTGPQIRVVEGADFLLASIPLPHPDDLNATEIEMTGKSIYNDLLSYPDYYACNWLIYGQVVGTTDRYIETGSGIVPVFEAEKVYPIMPLSDFFTLEVILFVKPPLGLLAALLLFLWPVVVIPILLLRKSKNGR